MKISLNTHTSHSDPEHCSVYSPGIPDQLLPMQKGNFCWLQSALGGTPAALPCPVHSPVEPGTALSTRAVLGEICFSGSFCLRVFVFENDFFPQIKTLHPFEFC